MVRVRGFVKASLKFSLKITKTFIYNSLKERLGIPIEVEDFFKTCIAKYVEKTGSLPTSEITRKIQASVYAMHTVGLQKTDNIDNPTSQIS